MATGTITSDTGSNLEIVAEWTATPDVSGNCSAVTVDVYLTHYSLYCGALSGSYVKIGTEIYNFTKAISQENDVYTKTHIATYSTTVDHLSDGTKSINISVGWNFSGTYNGVSIGMLEASKTVTLDPIPRASTLKAPFLVSIGSAYTFTVTSHLSSNRHKITFNLGESCVTTDYLGATTATLTIPTELAYAMTDGVTKEGTCVLHTYDSEGKKTGDHEVALLYKVPSDSDYKPSFTLKATPVSDSTLVNEKGLYVQGITKVKVDIEDVVCKYGATARFSLISIGATKYTGYSATSKELSSGETEIVAKVTDSRGLTLTKSLSVNVHPYCLPFAADVTVFRCDENGEESDGANCFSVCARKVFSSLDNTNKAEMFCSYKVHGTEFYASEFPLVSEEKTVVNAGLLPSNSYDVKVVCRDAAGGESESLAVIPTALVDMHMKNGSVRFGGYCEKKGFECNWDANFGAGVSIGEKPISDFVVEWGESGIWKYRKWNSGISECFGNSGVKSYSIKVPWGSLYHNETMGNSVAYPEGLFAERPVVKASPRREGSAVFITPKTVGSETATPDYYIVYPTEDNLSVSLDLYCVGRWK